MENTLQTTEKKLIFGIPQYEFLLLFVVHICALLTFVHNSAVHMIVSLVAIGCTCLLAFNPYIYLLLPVYMIFYEQIVPFSGFVGYRIYTLAVIASCLFNKKTKLTMKNVLFFMFLMAYTFAVILPNGSSRVIMCVINFLFLILYYDNYMTDNNNYKQFFCFFIFASVLSAVYGFLGGSSGMGNAIRVNGEYVEYTRFLATFNDPNYLGFIFNVAIFANICIRPRKGKIHWSALIICYVALLATLSITAIIVNLVCLAVYFVFIKKLNPLIIPVMVIGVIAVLGIYNYALHNDTGFISHFVYRINEKIVAFNEGDMSGTTSGRFDLAEKNLQQLEEKSFGGMLFGGSFITSVGFDERYFTVVSHNEFVDNILFFGILGTLFYWLYFLFNIRETYKKIMEDVQMKGLLITIKIIYLIYCFSLTIFPDIRLMFLFFI